MKKIVLFGVSSAARIAYYNLVLDSEYEVVAFTVDRAFINEKILFDLPVIPFEEIESHYPPEECQMLIYVGYLQMNKVRAEKYAQAKAKGYSLISYVSSKAVTYPDLTVGDNCMIGANTVIHPLAKIGNNVIIRENSYISHNSNIMDHCFVAGGVFISGNVTVEPYSFLGTTVTLKDGITIGEKSLIGAGVTMLHDSQPKEVYMNRSAQKLPMPSDGLKMS